MDIKVLETQRWLNAMYKGRAGYVIIAEDGKTGNGTFKALIRGLQIELHVSVDGIFGKAVSNALTNDINNRTVGKNIVTIIQGSLWCKGYNAGALDGIYGKNTRFAVMKFQSDAGVACDGIMRPYILQGVMNTEGYRVKDYSDADAIRKSYVQKEMNKYYGSRIGLTPCNGIWERKSHKNLLKACQLQWGCSVDGIWGSDTLNKAPTLSRESDNASSIRLMKWALTINGFYPGNLDANFDDKTFETIYEFQKFLKLAYNGTVGRNTWASLLSSKGNSDRKAFACDTSTRLTKNAVMDLKKAGYTDVGRYLTNVPGGRDKRLTCDELKALASAEMKVFPIFQTYGRTAGYFSKEQGKKDAYEAKVAAKILRFPTNTVIYFAVDYDVLTKDINENIMPYFEGINEILCGYYSTGVYGPRMLCSRLSENKLTERSFVSDMSSGYTGNIGQKMPENWAYDQFSSEKVASIEIDKCIASDRATAVKASLIVNNYEFRIKQLYDGLYNYACEYRKSANKREASEFVLQYLRTEKYGGLSIVGIAWATLGGKRDICFEELVTYKNVLDEKENDIIPIKMFTIYDDVYDMFIPIDHMAATLNAYLHNSKKYGTNSSNEKILDSYTGWAGDLHQMLARVYAEDIENGTSEIRNIKKYIASLDVDKGFSLLDMVQDVDAFNMYKLYDWDAMSVNEIFYDYYYVSQNNRKRYSLFYGFLMREFDADCISSIVEPFVDATYWVTLGFSFMWGKIPVEKASMIAEAFELRLKELIGTEK